MKITPLKQLIEESERYCYGCEEYHPNSFFKKDNNDETGLAKYCKVWDWILNQLRGALKRNCERNRRRSKERKRLLEFNIDDTFIFNQFKTQGWCCYYTNEEFDFPWLLNGTLNGRFTPTLDRVNNEEGYTQKNTVITVRWFNSMKANQNFEDLSNHIRNHSTSLDHANKVILKLRQKQKENEFTNRF